MRSKMKLERVGQFSSVQFRCICVTSSLPIARADAHTKRVRNLGFRVFVFAFRLRLGSSAALTFFPRQLAGVRDAAVLLRLVILIRLLRLIAALLLPSEALFEPTLRQRSLHRRHGYGAREFSGHLLAASERFDDPAARALQIGFQLGPGNPAVLLHIDVNGAHLALVAVRLLLAPVASEGG
eukprot:1177121-Prorocentrum_minimum.AAC.1